MSGETTVHEASEHSLPEAGDWFVLHTRSRQEKALAADLAARGIGHFLPTVRQVRYYGRRKVWAELPMFPGYVFLRGSREEAFEADRTRWVAQILPVSDQEMLDWELRNIHLALARQAPLDPYPYLEEGVLVEVRGGPFKGLQGVVEKKERPDRLRLQVDMLGRAMALEIEPSLLEPVR